MVVAVLPNLAVLTVVADTTYEARTLDVSAKGNLTVVDKVDTIITILCCDNTSNINSTTRLTLNGDISSVCGVRKYCLRLIHYTAYIDLAARTCQIQINICTLVVVEVCILLRCCGYICCNTCNIDECSCCLGSSHRNLTIVVAICASLILVVFIS